MEQSILRSAKKILGVAEDDPSFDLDIMTHINTAFSTLHELGVGPPLGFAIEDDQAEWEEFVFDDPTQLVKIKGYVYLKVRSLFDPPTVSYMLDAFQKQLQEAEWRISVRREGQSWTDPDPMRTLEPDAIDYEVIDIEGGHA